MACSVCGLSGHYKPTCARNRAKRIAKAIAQCGTSQIFSMGLDFICPGLGLTYEAAHAAIAVIRMHKNGGPSEEDLFEALMNA
jgi:hypothetical protein